MKKEIKLISIVLVLLSVVTIGFGIFFLMNNRNPKEKEKYYYCIQQLTNEDSYKEYAIITFEFDKERLITKFTTDIVYEIEYDEIYNDIISNFKQPSLVDTYAKDGKVTYSMDTSTSVIVGTSIDDYLAKLGDTVKCELKEKEDK